VNDTCGCRRYEIQRLLPRLGKRDVKGWVSVQDDLMRALRYTCLDDKKFRDDLCTARRAYGVNNVSVLCITETRIYLPKGVLK